MSKETANQEVLGNFDPHKVHYRDPKTHKVNLVKSFRVVIDQGKRYYEYPKGSGNLWWENRKPAGRFVDGRPKRDEAHVAWAPPVTQDQKIAEQNMVLKQELEKVQKELEGIKHEEELQKTHPVKPVVQAAPAKPPVESATKPQAKKEDKKDSKMI